MKARPTPAADADSSQPGTTPGPRSLPEWFDDVWNLPEDPITGLGRLQQKYGDVVQFYNPALRSRTFVLSHPDHVQHVLHEHQDRYRKAATYDFLRPLLGNGLLTNSGESWFRQRRLIAPLFHEKSLRTFTDVMVENTEELLRDWERSARRSNPVDLAADMRRLTLDIVGKCLFSTPMEDFSQDVGTALKTLMRWVNDRGTALVRLPRWVPTPSNRRATRALNRLGELVDGLIARRRGRAEEYDDLLSMLMLAEDEETGERMDNQQVHDEVMTFLMAGHETTANALTWTMYLLARHPRVDRKLHSATRNLDLRSADPFEILPEVPYVGQVIQEGMRRYPPAWLVERTPVSGDEVDGHRIPEGSIVILPSATVHHHPEFWDEPAAFRPERFTENRVEQRHPYSYVPFGGGKRLCIGREFAMIEAKIILSVLNRRFRLHLLDEPPIEYEALVTLQPRDGITVELEER